MKKKLVIAPRGAQKRVAFPVGIDILPDAKRMLKESSWSGQRFMGTRLDQFNPPFLLRKTWTRTAAAAGSSDPPAAGLVGDGL